MVVAVIILMVMMVLLLAGQQVDALGGIDGFAAVQNILHKFFQPCAGNNQGLRRLCHFDLVHLQGVVMQAGDGFCNQPSHTQGGILTERLGEVVYGQGGGGNVGGRLRFPTAGQKHYKYEKWDDFFHRLHLNPQRIYFQSTIVVNTLGQHRRMGQKLRRSPQFPLCGVALKKGAASRRS